MIFDVAGWDTGVGIQIWRGSSLNLDTTATPDPVSGFTGAAVTTTNATAIDGQMQGELGNMPVGFYVSYAKAPFDAVTANTYNMGGTLDRSSFNIAAELGVHPGVATLGAAIRRGKSGVDDGRGANAADNAIMLIATFKLSQNMMASLSFTKNTGSYWDLTPGAPGTAVPIQPSTTATLRRRRRTVEALPTRGTKVDRCSRIVRECRSREPRPTRRHPPCRQSRSSATADASATRYHPRRL